MYQLASLFIAIALLGCSKSEPAELKRAAAVVEYFLKPGNPSNTSFPVVLPNGTPRQFVSWYFSSMGINERPPLEGSEDDREFGEGLRAIGMPLRPQDFRYHHANPDPNDGKQIVVKWNDQTHMVIIEGYLDPTRPPVLVHEIQLPKVTSTNQLARLTAQSNLEMGMSFQGFE